MKRKKASSFGHKKKFSRTAGMTHKLNAPRFQMRGGIRK
jgi:hypothetical protein